MVSGIANFLSNPVLSNIAQSTTASVSLETGMKAVGRPSFILADKKLDPQTKRYAAMKEFLYQATCLATYMLVVIPIFKKGAFKLAKNCKFDPAFEKFNSAGEYLDYHKIAKKSKSERAAAIDKSKFKDKFSQEIKDELLNKEKPDSFHMIKGAVELGNIVGSVIGLAILAPQVSHLIVHPALKLFGFEKKEAEKNVEQTQTLDTKA